MNNSQRPLKPAVSVRGWLWLAFLLPLSGCQREQISVYTIPKEGDPMLARANAAPGTTPFLQLPQFSLRGRRGPIDIWCVPALERLTL